jgi:hypothetical protein
MASRLHPKLFPIIQRLAEVEAMRDKVIRLLKEQLGPDYSTSHPLYTALVHPYLSAVADQRMALMIAELEVKVGLGKRVKITGGKQKKGLTGRVAWHQDDRVLVKTAEGEVFLKTDQVEVVGE